MNILKAFCVILLESKVKMVSILLTFFYGILTIVFIREGYVPMSALCEMVFVMNLMNTIDYIYNKFKK